MPSEVGVIVEPPLPDIVVVVEQALPEIQVYVEPSQEGVEVTISEVGLVGPQGPPGPSGEDGFPQALHDHINSATPHPAYDDGPSLELLYQNAKV